MTSKIRNVLFLYIFLSFITINPVAQAGKDDFNYQVPNEWMQSEADPSSIHAPDAFTESFDHLLSTTLSPLENHSKKMDLQGMNTLGTNKWGIKAAIFDLAVSTSGGLGLLIMKGTAAATVTWVPKKATQPINATEANAIEASSTDAEHSTIKLNAFEDDIEALVEPAVKGIMATGKVNNEIQLRSNLTKITKSFHNLVVGIQTSKLTRWDLSRLRFDLAVSATGTVAPFTTLGGGVKVRLEWYPNSKTFSKFQTPIDENIRKVQGQISALIEKLASEVETWSQTDPLMKKSLDLNSLRFGLGLTAKFDIALVKNSAGATFYAYFAKKQKPAKPMSLSALKLLALKDPKSLQVLTEDLMDENNERWEQLLVGTLQYSTSKEKKDPLDKLVQIKGEKFRKGLSRASRIGQFFVERTAKVSEKSHWELQSLKVNFELSSSGSLSVATLSGALSTELNFKPITK